MLQKLKNEDLNSQKIALCKKNNILCKQMACDESTLVKGVYYWNTLRKEEKEKLLNEIGRSLTPIIADRISALTQNDKTSKDINAVCQEQAQTKFKKEKKPRAEIESQKVDFDEASRDDRTLNLLSVFDLILDWKAGAQSKSCHSFVRLMLRVLNEKSSKDLLADLGCCLVVSKFFADRLFLGQKAVVSYTLLGDLGLAVLEAIGSSIVDQTSLENDCHKLALSIPEKTEHTASIKVKKVDSHSNAEKNKRSSKLIEEIEGSLFTFAVMFENRLLEMVNYHEVFFGANQGKLFNMMPYMQTERDVYDPDRVVCRFQLPLNNKNIGKNKPLPENQRLFKVRRAIRRIQTERIIGNQSDYMMFQAFSFQNGYSYQISPPENAILSIRVSKEIQEFKLMLNIVKKPTNNRNQGHNYNYGNGHGYRGHNMRSFNPQFGNFLASQYHGKGNYGMGYGQNGGREHISNSRDEIGMNNMLAMRKAFTALASNTEGQGSLQDTQTSSMTSVAHLLMGNGSFDNQESVSSTYMKGTPGNGSSSPSSPQLHLQVFNSLDQASNVNAQHFKEEIGDNRLEPDTKEGSLTSGRDHQDMLSSGNTLPDKLLPREKKKLKPTSSCYYYQQNNVAPVATFLPQKEEIPSDKMSLNLETQTRPGFVIDDSTKSVKNYNVGHSKRKNTETMHSPQIDCLSGGASEFSNLNFPKLEPNMGIDSPISTRSIELVKTKSNRDKNEKKTWRNGDNDKMTGKQLEDKQRAEIYRNDGQRRYVNSPKQHYAKKRHPNGGGNNGNNGASKQGASSGAGSLYQSTGLNDDNFPRIDEMPDTKVKVKRSEHFDRQDKLPLGLHQPTENRRRRGGDRKTKK